jgi:hypothetical protein
MIIKLWISYGIRVFFLLSVLQIKKIDEIQDAGYRHGWYLVTDDHTISEENKEMLFKAQERFMLFWHQGDQHQRW